LENGIPYFTAAGNRARDAWEAPAVFDAVRGRGNFYHRFGFDGNGAPILSQRVTMKNNIDNTGVSRRFVLQWDNPFYSVSGAPGEKSDLDLILSINGKIVASGMDNNIGKDPGTKPVLHPPNFPAMKP
jgi:hypothetical protein